MKKTTAAAQSHFIHSVAVILFITAATEVLATFSTAQLLNRRDAILLLTNRQVLLLAAGLELGLSAYLLMGLRERTKLMLLAWMSTIAAVYHVGSLWNGSLDLFGCLGNLTDKFSISPRLLTNVETPLLCLVLVGGYVFLFLGWLDDRAHVRDKTDILNLEEAKPNV